jgi:hypothetical protein
VARRKHAKAERSRGESPNHNSPLPLGEGPGVRADGTAAYWLLLACALAVAAFLRLYMLSSQVFMDDEWHSLRTIADNGFSYWNTVAQFDPRNNTSVLLNLYGLFLYDNFGWTEWAFRLPVLLAGLLVVVLLPLLLRPVFGDRASLTAAFLLAISPFLVFYSRFYRAYEFVVLLGFAALLLAHRWLTTGQRRWGVAYFVAAVLAVYFHLLAAIAVFSPLAAALGMALTRRSPGGHATIRVEVASPPQERLVVPPRTILIVASCLIVCLIPLAIPLLRADESLPWVKGALSPSAFVRILTLVSGTSNVVLSLLFLALWVAGHVWLGRHKPVLSWIFLCTLYAYVLAVFVARPAGCDEGRILLRYAIVVVPIALSTVSLALDRFLQTPWGRNIGRWGAGGVCVVFVTCLGAVGPLWRVYAPPNNFTNHAAFQGAYSPLTWECSDAPPRREYFGPSIEQTQVPEFYRRLSAMKDVATIIEHPFDICNFNDQLYYYQHFHKKRVLVGYCVDPAQNDYTNDLSPDEVKDGFDTTGVYLDGIFYYVPDRSRLHFQNIVDLADANAIASSGADVLVLHKSATVMTTASQNRTGQCHVFYHFVEAYRRHFEAQFGPPLYEDDALLCFRIGASRSSAAAVP